MYFNILICICFVLPIINSVTFSLGKLAFFSTMSVCNLKLLGGTSRRMGHDLYLVNSRPACLHRTKPLKTNKQKNKRERENKNFL